MRIPITSLLIMVALFPAVASATDVEGDVWGTWTRENSPYNVIGEVRVPPGSTLVIEPAVVVNFQGHYKFIVDSLATLLAVGTEIDSICFAPEDTATGWHGIRFIHASANSRISYSVLEYGKALGDGDERHGGAIYCLFSRPTISNNCVRGNYADEYGGGIYCKTSNPMISGNYISDNWARGGGGVFCNDYSSPEISRNTISGNTVRFNGGGIYCWLDSSPTIRNNTIAGNWARWNGGGIYCNRYSSPTIVNNVITENSADWSFGGGIYCYQYSDPSVTGNDISGNFADLGGGIYCWYASPTISSNVISGNFVYYHGGGILCEQSYSAISNNTIGANLAAWGHGGGICSINSNLRITNTILWGDSASVGREIHVEEGSDPNVTYCDVQGGWPGQGNIDADPMFAGPYNEDFHLRWHSPCIDAGDPSFPLDPDGTRSDIGAFYFNQDVHGIVELYPYNTPIIIPPEGGDIIYDGWVFNFSGHSGRADIWTYVFVPEIGQYGPIDLYESIRIPVDSLGITQIDQHVPGVAPEGEYVFVAYVGEYPTTIIDSSYFYFAKTGSIPGGTDAWFGTNAWLNHITLTEGNLPSHYDLSQNYPNPFNVTTNINYQLPVDGWVRLEVYNVLGEKVATLVEEKQEAGYRSVIWEASELSSGLYFYKLTAGDFTETKRMVLAK